MSDAEWVRLETEVQERKRQVAHYIALLDAANEQHRAHVKRVMQAAEKRGYQRAVAEGAAGADMQELARLRREVETLRCRIETAHAALDGSWNPDDE